MKSTATAHFGGVLYLHRFFRFSTANALQPDLIWPWFVDFFHLQNVSDKAEKKGGEKKPKIRLPGAANLHKLQRTVHLISVWFTVVSNSFGDVLTLHRSVNCSSLCCGFGVSAVGADGKGLRWCLEGSKSQIRERSVYKDVTMIDLAWGKKVDEADCVGGPFLCSPCNDLA